MKSMKRLFTLLLIVTLLGLLPCVALATGEYESEPVTAPSITVLVQTSDGAAIPGVAIKGIKTGGYFGDYGSTDATGKLVLNNVEPGEYTLTAYYAGTIATETVTVTLSEPSKNVTFNTVNARVKVLAANNADGLEGAPLQGVEVKYKNDYLYDLGLTGADGIAQRELFPGLYQFEARYRGTVSAVVPVEITATDVGEGVHHTFKTVEACAKVQDGAGNALKGAAVAVQTLYGYEMTTDENGIAVMQLFPGTYTLSARYAGTTSAAQTVDITNPDADVTFEATRVTLSFPGTITYKNTYDYSFNQPTMAMFPGTYAFTFSVWGQPSVVRNITIGTTPYEASAACVTLKSSAGVGLAGGTVSYYAAGAWTYNAAVTDEKGLALLLLPAGKVATSVSMNYKGGIQQINQNMSVNPYYQFVTKSVQFTLIDSKNKLLAGTAEYYFGAWYKFGDDGAGQANTSMELLPVSYSFSVGYKGALQQVDGIDIATTDEVVFKTRSFTVRLIDSKGNDLAGGVEYYAGAWGKFGDNGEGTANIAMELLPVKYSFAAIYNGARQQKDGIDVAANSELVFQTGSVTLHYAGGSLGFYTSQWFNYTGTVELLPVKTLFDFAKSGYPTYRLELTPEAGKAYEKTVAYIKLANSAGAGLAGGEAKYYDGAWYPLGTTDASGVCFGLIDGNKAQNLTFGMTFGGGYVQKPQNLATDSHVLFQTKSVVFKLLSAKGEELKGDATYYANGWKTFGGGQTTGTMEMLPASYTFGVNYLGGYIQKAQDIAVNPVVVFNTVPVTFELKSSTGEALTGEATYYANGWKTFGEGTTPGTMEMLPVSYTFGIKYLGATMQKAQDVSTNPAVVFNTVPVTFKLLSSAGDTLKGEPRFYAGSWQTFGNGATPGSMEMLPVSYTFGVGYLGASIQKTQDVSKNALVVFRTTPVIINLYVPVKIIGITVKVPVAGGIGGDASFYAGGWQNMGKTPEYKELLPTTYTFAVNFMGQYQQKSQDVSKNAFVEFATTQELVLKAIKQASK